MAGRSVGGGKEKTVTFAGTAADATRMTPAWNSVAGRPTDSVLAVAERDAVGPRIFPWPLRLRASHFSTLTAIASLECIERKPCHAKVVGFDQAQA
jgi:hypothetical protein